MFLDGLLLNRGFRKRKKSQVGLLDLLYSVLFIQSGLTAVFFFWLFIYLVFLFFFFGAFIRFSFLISILFF